MVATAQVSGDDSIDYRLIGDAMLYDTTLA